MKSVIAVLLSVIVALAPLVPVHGASQDGHQQDHAISQSDGQHGHCMSPNGGHIGHPGCCAAMGAVCFDCVTALSDTPEFLMVALPVHNGGPAWNAWRDITPQSTAPPPKS